MADRMLEDQGEDAEINTYKDAVSLNGLYPVEGGDDADKNKYQKLLFLQNCWSRHYAVVCLPGSRWR
jgi:hypothetical protein